MDTFRTYEIALQMGNTAGKQPLPKGQVMTHNGRSPNYTGAAKKGGKRSSNFNKIISWLCGAPAQDRLESF
jgi:hypothetical protein